MLPVETRQHVLKLRVACVFQIIMLWCSLQFTTFVREFYSEIHFPLIHLFERRMEHCHMLQTAQTMSRVVLSIGSHTKPVHRLRPSLLGTSCVTHERWLWLLRTHYWYALRTYILVAKRT